MLVCPMPSCFFDTCNLFMPSLECKALYIFIIFLVLWFICWSSSLVHFKNGPEYLVRSIAQMLISFIRFSLQSLVSRSFFISLRYIFLIFSFTVTCLMVSASSIPKYMWFSFFRTFWFFFDLAVLFLPLFFFFYFSLSTWHIFLC